jgi:acyl-CoA reductase-like NAD-dependent aldehyde dehydrogenase
MSTTAAPDAVRTVNPATGAPLAEYRPHDHAAVDRALDAARSAFSDWRATDLGRRSALFERIAAHLRAQKSELAALVTNEMGKPIVEAEAEVEKCAIGCEYFARAAKRKTCQSGKFHGMIASTVPSGRNPT